MLSPTVLAAFLAAIPSVLAQDSTASSTRCTTRFGFNPLPTGTAGVPTWYSFTTTTNTARITSTTQDTVSVTPVAATSTDIVRTTLVISTTSTTTPAAATIATPRAFMPLLLVNVANPTPIPRIKRHAHSGLEVSHPLKRQTAPGNTGGFIVDRDGSTSAMNRIFPRRVDCRVMVSVNTTMVSIVTAEPTTVTAMQSTTTAFSTSTILTTMTFTEIAPTPTVYAACAGNNVVNHVTDIDGNKLVFDRVVYRPQEGFPISNELVANTSSPVNCCIACQNTPNCAGSFYAPSRSECHLRLTAPFNPPPPTPPTLPPYANYTLPPYANYTYTPTGYPTGYATGTAASEALVPISTGTPATCALGSLTLYLGTIRGQSDFPDDVALVFSNGPCGRFSVSPIPIADDGGDGPETKMLRLGKM